MIDLTTMYIIIGGFAYITILFLTWRDLRIFRRTGYGSYRKGALKGIIASTLVLFGILVIYMMHVSEIVGLSLVFLGLMVNQKGKRETVFTTAKTWDRFIGQTDVIRTTEEIREDYARLQGEKKRLEKEQERAQRIKRRREKMEADGSEDENEDEENEDEKNEE